MTSIIKYKKFITPEITRDLRLPEGEDRQRLAQELATVDGDTYVFLPDCAALPDGQPPEIADTIESVTLTPSLRDAICNASPLVLHIRTRIGEMIAERYSQSDEIKLLRTAPSDEFERYNAYAEECRAWGQGEKAKLGL